jgi:transcriptional regulator
MYLPSHFEENRAEVLHELVRAQPFGLLITTGGPLGIEANAIPFLVDADVGPHGTLVGHVARGNPVWRHTPAGSEALVVFQGPQAYVSPNWYPSKAETGKAVPTWNYVMVQARGTLRVTEDPETLRGIVTRLTRRHEGVQPQPWAVTDAPPEYIETMLRAIIGIEITLSSLRGKWKLSQNRPAADRHGAAQALRQVGSGDLAAMMENA